MFATRLLLASVMAAWLLGPASGFLNLLKLPSRQFKLGCAIEESFEAAPNPDFFFSKKDFKAIGVSDVMEGVISELSLERPSKIQALSFVDIHAGKNCIVADQTGSGKSKSKIQEIGLLLYTVGILILIQRRVAH